MSNKLPGESQCCWLVGQTLGNRPGGDCVAPNSLRVTSTEITASREKQLIKEKQQLVE